MAQNYVRNEFANAPKRCFASIAKEFQILRRRRLRREKRGIYYVHEVEGAIEVRSRCCAVGGAIEVEGAAELRSR